MSTFIVLALIGAAGLIGWRGTILVERLAPRLGLVQAPNARSSHVIPTPRGGGLAIAIATILAGLALAGTMAPGLWLTSALIAAIAALGFADDLRDLPAAARFPIQIAVVAALVWAAWPMPALPILSGLSLSGGLLAAAVLLVGLWWLNLFNFMDGIDGIAGSQAVILLLAGSALWWSADPLALQHPLLWLALASAAATLGFLVRNWPPAHIFMGDAGSNALALIILALALASIAAGDVAYPAWLILPAVFVADATTTLLRRLLRGERPWHAHRRHAYQHLSRRLGHRATTLLASGLTLAWATPLAFFAQHWPALAWPLLVLAYLPLIALAIAAGAGSADEKHSLLS